MERAGIEETGPTIEEVRRAIEEGNGSLKFYESVPEEVLVFLSHDPGELQRFWEIYEAALHSPQTKIITPFGVFCEYMDHATHPCLDGGICLEKEIRRLSTEFYVEIYPEEDSAYIRSVVEGELQKERIYTIAIRTDKGKGIGFSSCENGPKEFDLKERGRTPVLYVYDFYVALDFRNKGVGKAIYERLEDIVRQSEFMDHILFHLNANQGCAWDFFTEKGYEEVENQGEYILMVKEVI